MIIYTGKHLPWNHCRRCEYPVGIHSLRHGDKVGCSMCIAEYEFCQLDDGSWMLIGPLVNDAEL